MDSCQDAKVIQSLRTILKGPYGEETRLKMLKEIESRHRNGTKLTILSHLIKMVPLTQSLVSLRRLMMLFSRKVMVLLKEMEILEKKDVAQETLQLIKQFWSLCSNQQLVVAPIQTHGQWLPVLLEIVTSLASIYIDLFIVSYEHSENETLWSKRLYSWLTYDLSEREIKTAFLEVSCPTNKASKLLSPVLSKILASPLDPNSHMDYLLHMLLLKKWSKFCDQADIETSRNIKAPKTFVSWLSERWGNSHDYIPQDKSLKGRRVTDLILDLDDEAVESLIDMFTDCLMGRSDMVDITGSTKLEEERLTAGHFVVDKKGSGHNTQDSEMLPQTSVSSDAREGNEEAPGPSFILDTKGSEVVMQVSDSEDEVQFIKKSNDRKPKGQKRKHETAEPSSILLAGTEELNYYIIPDRTSETNSSPKRKKQKIRTRNEEINDIFVAHKSSERRHESDISHEEVEILNDEGDRHSDDDDNDNPLGLDVIDFESLTELENTEAGTSRVIIKKPRAKGIPQQSAYTNNKDTALKSGHIVSKDIAEENEDEEVIEVDTRSQGVDNGENDIVEVFVEASQRGKGRKNQTQAKTNTSKPLVFSDLGSSHLTLQEKNKYIDKTGIYDLTEESEEDFRIFDEEVSISSETPDSNFARDSKIESPKTPKRRKRSSDKGIVHHGRSKEKQTVITIVDDSVKKNVSEDEHSRSVVILSEDDKKRFCRKSSDKLAPSKAIIIPEDSSDGEITFKESLNINVIVPSLEEDISQQLSSIRRKVSQTSESQAHSELSGSIASSRRSTRLRTRSEGEESGSNVNLPTKHQVTSGKKSRNEKMSMATGASPSILKDWLRSTPGKLPDEVSKIQTSPLKSAKKSLDVGAIDSEQSPKATTSAEEKKQNVKSSVKNKPIKTSSVISSEEKRQTLTRSDIFKPVTTYSRIKQKNLSAQKRSSASKEASASPTNSLTEDQRSPYSLRAHRKSDIPKSVKNKTSPDRKRSFLSQETGPSNAEFQTTPKRIPEDKLNKSGTADKESTSTSLTTKSKKTPQSSSKLSPKPSSANRRKSLRSAGKTDKGKGTT